jgi:hypothetical protein
VRVFCTVSGLGIQHISVMTSLAYMAGRDVTLCMRRMRAPACIGCRAVLFTTMLCMHV